MRKLIVLPRRLWNERRHDREHVRHEFHGRYIVKRISRREQSAQRRKPPIEGPRAHVPLKYISYIAGRRASTGEDTRRIIRSPPSSPHVHKGEILSRARCPISRAGLPLSIVILSIAHTHVYAPHLRDELELHRFYATAIKKFISTACVISRLKNPTC